LTQSGEVGFVSEVIGPIAYVEGIPGVHLQELVYFEDGSQGRVFSLFENRVEVLTFSNTPVKVGSKVARTGGAIKIPVGPELLGQIIDPFGNSYDNHKLFKKPTDTRVLNTAPPGISKRKTIKKYFETGVSLVDLMVPLGYGQRELVIGDRKTGKTDFLLQTIVYAAKNNLVCIYAAVGKNRIDIKRAWEYFTANGVEKNIILIASASEDPAGLNFLTPYTGMTIAEYFRDEGKDVLLVLDDLSTHAKFYREISLISKRFPGRDSYPGDMFYVHSRLLERAGNFEGKNGDVSITCLPVVETLQADLSGYIQTNIMSMTDGHIYFDSGLFTAGRRPSVNPFLSVTRVGRQTQSDSARSISRELLSFLTLYDKMQNVVHFGSELTANVLTILVTGDKILQLFDQATESVVPPNVQAITLSLLWGDDFKKLEISKLIYYKNKISQQYQTDPKYKKMIDDLVLTSNSFNQILDKIRKDPAKIGVEIPQQSAITQAPAAAAQAAAEPEAKGGDK
jgi:F-type H+/Na+-transporting ATPase subunit alpha